MVFSGEEPLREGERERESISFRNSYIILKNTDEMKANEEFLVLSMVFSDS